MGKGRGREGAREGGLRDLVFTKDRTAAKQLPGGRHYSVERLATDFFGILRIEETQFILIVVFCLTFLTAESSIMIIHLLSLKALCIYLRALCALRSTGILCTASSLESFSLTTPCMSETGLMRRRYCCPRVQETSA